MNRKSSAATSGMVDPEGAEEGQWSPGLFSSLSVEWICQLQITYIKLEHLPLTCGRKTVAGWRQIGFTLHSEEMEPLLNLNSVHISFMILAEAHTQKFKAFSLPTSSKSIVHRSSLNLCDIMVEYSIIPACPVAVTDVYHVYQVLI